VAKNYLEEAKNTNRSFDVVFVSDATQRGGLRKKKIQEWQLFSKPRVNQGFDVGEKIKLLSKCFLLIIDQKLQFWSK